MSRAAICGAIACVALASGELVAQTTSGGAPWCFRGKPLPRCATIVLYEFSFYRHAAGSELEERYDPPGAPGYSIQRNVFQSHLSFSLGVLRNVSMTTGLGALVDAGVGEDSYERVALLGRYRRWLGNSASLDLSLGPALVNVNEPVVQPQTIFLEPHRRVALTGDVTLRLNDWLAGSARFDVAPGHKPSAASALYAGVRVGSWQAVGATALVALWVGAAIAALTGTDY